MYLKLFTCVAVGLSLSACAWTSVKPIYTPADHSTPGFRYYDIKPIMIVDANSSITIRTIPNMNRAYAVNFHAFLAKNNSNLRLTQLGTLEGASISHDSTDAIKLIQDVVGMALPGILERNNMAPGAGEAQGKCLLKPGLYDFVFDGEGNLCRLQRIEIVPDCVPTGPLPPAGGGSNQSEK